MEDADGVIQGNNSAGHCLSCTKEFNSNELFQRSHDYESENVHHKQIFW